MIEATHEITACYFPKKGEAELSFKDLDSGEKVEFTVKLDKETGMRLSEIVWPCVYSGAVVGKGV